MINITCNNKEVRSGTCADIGDSNVVAYISFFDTINNTERKLYQPVYGDFKTSTAYLFDLSGNSITLTYADSNKTRTELEDLLVDCCGCVGGDGTVTSFSAGNLSPLFTTNVATPTTTPALSFNLSNCNQYQVFGRVVAGTGAPSYVPLNPIAFNGLAIPNREVAFGTGTGITSTSNFQFTTSKSLKIGTGTVTGEYGINMGTGSNASDYVLNIGSGIVNNQGKYSLIICGSGSEISGSGDAILSVLLGGNNNKIIAGTDTYCNVIMGKTNTVTSTTGNTTYNRILGNDNSITDAYYNNILGINNTVSGGYLNNIIGRYCNNGGYTGVMLLSDGGTSTLTATASNQFNSRFSGGYRFMKDGSTQWMAIAPTTGYVTINNIPTAASATDILVSNGGVVSTRTVASLGIPVITPAALTKTDDTNVTISLGGTPATALLQGVSLTMGWAGVLAISRGGTGLGSLGTANQVLRVNAGGTALEYATLTDLDAQTLTWTKATSNLAISNGNSVNLFSLTSLASGDLIKWNGSDWVNWTPAALTKTDDTNVTISLGGTPATALLEAVSLTLGWTGILAIGRGGTGLGTLGTVNQLLRVNSGGTALEYFSPTWTSNTGTVTSVAASVGGTALGVSGTPITSSGTLAFAWAGTSGQYVDGQGNLQNFPAIPAGTVTSVALALPSNTFDISGSPVTSLGTLTGAFKSQIKKTVLAAPWGADGTPIWRQLQTSDLQQNGATTGQVITWNGTEWAAANPPGGVTSVAAGNGMNFTTITATGSVVLGTPSSITLSSTNSVTSTSHTHAFVPGGTSSQYIRGDGVLQAFPTIPSVAGKYVALSDADAGYSGQLSAVNLNDYTKTQVIYSNGNVTNNPNANSYVVWIGSVANTYGAQMAINPSVSDKFFFRNNYNTSWSSWYQVASREWVISQNYLTAGSGNAVWKIQGGSTDATTNTDNIYHNAKVRIGDSTASSFQLSVVGQAYISSGAIINNSVYYSAYASDAVATELLGITSSNLIKVGAPKSGSKSFDIYLPNYTSSRAADTMSAGDSFLFAASSGVMYKQGGQWVRNYGASVFTTADESHIADSTPRRVTFDSYVCNNDYGYFSYSFSSGDYKVAGATGQMFMVICTLEYTTSGTPTVTAQLRVGGATKETNISTSADGRKVMTIHTFTAGGGSGNFEVYLSVSGSAIELKKCRLSVMPLGAECP